MGAADIVPGVSGGTVALVLGIYERLISNVHMGASALKALLKRDISGFRTKLGSVEWVWLISLLVGVLAAVAVLSSIIEELLHDHPMKMAGLFFGLVVGSAFVAWRLIKQVNAPELGMMLGIAVAMFFVLGLRTDTEVAEGTVEAVTQPAWVFFFAGALAICAMILPGVSGSFILVMIGMYTNVLGAVNDREIVPLLATALGCIVGLAIFSSVLNWLLEHHHDLVIAAMIGLLVGSLRVLWPWPNGVFTTRLEAPADDVGWPIGLAVIGLVVVLAVEVIATKFGSHGDAPTDGETVAATAAPAPAAAADPTINQRVATPSADANALGLVTPSAAPIAAPDAPANPTLTVGRPPANWPPPRV